MFAGYFLYLKKVINDKFCDQLSQLLIKVIFPCLIIYKIISHFSFTEYKEWWILPLSAVITIVAGIIVAALTLIFTKNSISSKKEYLCSAGFQNCGYLAMNLILFSFLGPIREKLLIYMFLYIIGFNLLMWSLVPMFLAGNIKTTFKWRKLINPPVGATIVSILWVSIFGKGNMPSIILEPMGQLGQAAFPLAMLILGAYLYKYRAHIPETKLPVILAVFIKMFVLPAIILGVLTLIPLSGVLRFFIFLEAILPAAVSLVVIGSFTGADNKLFSSVIFYTHLLAIVTIPLWLVVYRNVFNV